MNDQDTSLPEPVSAEGLLALKAEIARLRAERDERNAKAAELEAENARLAAQMVQLATQAEELEGERERLLSRTGELQSEHQRLLWRTGELQSEHEQLLRRTGELEVHSAHLCALKEGLEAQLQEVLAELAELKRQLFGQKAERLTREEEAQLTELAADLQEQARRDPPASDEVLEDEAEADPSRKRTRRRRHPLPEHLERQTVVVEPERLDRCSECGQIPGCIGEETTEELDFVPAKLIVRRTVRRKYACRCGCGGVHIAPLPPRLVPQSKLGSALAVHILLARFDDHVAYYTLERIFLERHQVVVPRQQMVQWVAQIAFLLQPLVKLMFERMKQGGYLQIDETPVKVMDPEVKGKCARGYLWFYAVPGGDVFLDFQDTRGRKAPHAQLAGFSGTIQTDAYEVYDSLKKVVPGLVRIGCAAHARRKFHRAVKDGEGRAVAFIGLFRQLYRLEREARDLTPEGRQELRQQKAAPLWASLKEKAAALRPQVLPQSSLGKALSYLLNEYEALTGYLQSGHYQIDNNLVENSIRVPAVGRRRWLFIGHPDAGWRSAVIYSLIVSCRRRGINPQEYLADVLRRLPSMDITRIGELLPEHWKPPAPA
jgi:transposase